MSSLSESASTNDPLYHLSWHGCAQGAQHPGGAPRRGEDTEAIDQFIDGLPTLKRWQSSWPAMAVRAR